jgi:hypothetical protein
MMNSADKTIGWDNGQIANGFGGVDTSQSLDFAAGAGALNLDHAFDQYLTAGTRDVAGVGGGTVQETGWGLGTISDGTINQYIIDDQLEGGTELTVTLDWFREHNSNIDGQFNEIAQADLQLFIRDILSGDLIASSVSDFNVVEHLSFLLSGTSRDAIEVLYQGNTFVNSLFPGTYDSESYGLAWSGVAAQNIDAPAPGTGGLLLAGMLLVWRKRWGR